MVKYICFCDMTPVFLRLSLDEREKYIPKWIDLAKKHGLKVLFWGSPTGVRENVVVVLESKTLSDNYMKFQREWQGLGTTEARKFIEYTRTITVY
jgi:hypothetical protein